MDIETVITNAKEAVIRLNIAGERMRGDKTGLCHRFVLEALTGATSSPILFGYQQINAERASGFIRSDPVAASYHQLDDVIEEPFPGVPIIIEGATHQHPSETHCACVMAGPDGRFVIVDTLQRNRLSIVFSPGELLSWARQTFDLSTAQFWLIDEGLRGV